MTTAQVVETSVTVNNNSPIQDFIHLDDQTQPTFNNLYFVNKCEAVFYRAKQIFQVHLNQVLTWILLSC